MVKLGKQSYFGQSNEEAEPIEPLWPVHGMCEWCSNQHAFFWKNFQILQFSILFSYSLTANFLDLFFRILLTTNKALLILCSTLDVSSTLLILVHVMVAFQRINSTMSGYFALTEHWNLTPNSHHFSCMFSSVVTYSIDFTEGIKITPLRPLQISIYFIFSLIRNMFILKIRQHR